MDKQYFFILGRNPELSRAELHALLPTGYRTLACSREVLVVECGGLDVSTLMRRLGGTVKIGEIIESHNPSQPAWPAGRPPLNLRGGESGNVPPLRLRGGRGSYDNVINSLAWPQIAGKKLFLGLSAYALDGQARLPNVRELRELGMELKRELQTPSQFPPSQGGEKRGVRLVTSRERALSSVIVEKEKLLSQGVEIVLFYGSPPAANQILAPHHIGRTLAVQEFEQASIRDFGRPVREMKVGMLPIQLAKILINLARAPLNATLLDPFCGFGTVLTEAALMDYHNLIGSDLEKTMIEATRKNINWLLSDSRETENAQLFTAPVEQLSQHLPPHFVDAIVTEPYLGPIRPMVNYARSSQFDHTLNQLMTLYINAFREFAKILKPGGRVVFIFPAFKHGNTITKTSTFVLPQIKTLGFQPMPLLPNYLITQLPNYSIVYSRPSQSVLREIFVFEFKPQI